MSVMAAASGDSASVDERTLLAMAQMLYRRLLSRLNKQNNKQSIEFEVRLCTLLSRAKDNNKNNSNANANSAHDVVVYPAFATNREQSSHPGPTVEMGVTDADFARIVHHIRHATPHDAHDNNGSDTTSEALAWRSTVEVLGKNKTRYKYVPLPDNGDAEQPMFQLVEVVKKERVCVVDVAMPGAAYDMRVAMSNEEAVQLPSLSGAADDDAKGSKPVPEQFMMPGYKRFKERLHVRDGAVSYDLTRVRVQETNEVAYEVEIEYVYTPTAKEPERVVEVLPYKVLVTLLRCAAELACLHSLQGVTNPTATTRHDALA